MTRIFPLNVITQMKMKCISQLNNEIELAKKHGWRAHMEACEREIASTKREAMNPSEVWNG